jgi:hypothetical protein
VGSAAVATALVVALMAGANADESPNINAKPAASLRQEDQTWIQTDPLSFKQGISGANTVYQQISGVPELKIPSSGAWEVAYQARVYVYSADRSGQSITTAVFKNGELIPGSEAMASFTAEASGTTHTIGQTFMHTFAEGDLVTLHAYRIGTISPTVASDRHGRTMVMAHLVDSES